MCTPKSILIYANDVLAQVVEDLNLDSAPAQRIESRSNWPCALFVNSNTPFP